MTAAAETDGALRFNAKVNRYEMNVGDAIVFADIHRDGDVVHIRHVEAPAALRGTGAASRFMEVLMAELRGQNVKVVPICGYAAAWIKKHADYADMVV